MITGEPSPDRHADDAGGPIRIGALVPLSPPGWVEAGRHLLAGLEWGVREVNDAGGVAGRPLELVVRDTAADPQRASAAVDELAHLGVVALAGEYHSVVARVAAGRADALGLPFLCSSAVLDGLTEQRTDQVARLSPPQSRGWRIYADHLLAEGHRRVAVVTQPSVYWAAGTGILRDHFAAYGGTVVELDGGALTPEDVCDALVDRSATALVLLVGHPQPAVPIVRAVRRDRRLAVRRAPGRAGPGLRRDPVVRTLGRRVTAMWSYAAMVRRPAPARDRGTVYRTSPPAAGRTSTPAPRADPTSMAASATTSATR